MNRKLSWAFPTNLNCFRYLKLFNQTEIPLFIAIIPQTQRSSRTHPRKAYSGGSFLSVGTFGECSFLKLNKITTWLDKQVISKIINASSSSAGKQKLNICCRQDKNRLGENGPRYIYESYFYSPNLIDCFWYVWRNRISQMGPVFVCMCSVDGKEG